MTIESTLKCQILPVTPFQQNCSLIWDTATMRGALVDAGGEAERLLAAAQAKGITIEKLLVTHGHLDHAGAVKHLSEQLDVPVEGPHPDDMFWLQRMEKSALEYGFPSVRNFEPDRWLAHGDSVQVGDIKFDVIHCPGHTPGHVVFYQPQARLAFVGDVLFQGSIGRSDFERGNYDDLIRSIRERLFPLGDDITFVPGHGPLSTFGQERKSNPYVADRAFAR